MINRCLNKGKWVYFLFLCIYIHTLALCCSGVAQNRMRYVCMLKLSGACSCTSKYVYNITCSTAQLVLYDKRPLFWFGSSFGCKFVSFGVFFVWAYIFFFFHFEYKREDIKFQEHVQLPFELFSCYRA